MKRNYLVYVPFVLFLSVFVLWGCPKKAEQTIAPETPAEAAPAPVKEESKAEPQAAPEPAKAAPQEEVKEQAAAAQGGLQPIYFDFDKSFVRDDAKSVMKANAEWLKANPKVKVRIEGNCDERGTIEYNQALGQRRAASAKKYLTDLGISGKRISLISYGKEKPICTESTEDCWQKNRRDDIAPVAE